MGYTRIYGATARSDAETLAFAHPIQWTVGLILRSIYSPLVMFLLFSISFAKPPLLLNLGQLSKVSPTALAIQ